MTPANVVRKMTRYMAPALALTTALGLASSAAIAADFSGKRIEMIIPFGTGGGSDAWARFFAPLLGPQLPGKPVVVVKNMPGASSTKGSNYFQERARPDGMMILGTSGSTQFPYLLDDSRVKYDYKDWTVFLATPTGGVAYISPELGITSAAELAKIRGEELKFGSQGATSLDLVPLLAFEILGLDVKPIFGMKGRGPARLAFERGEVRIDYQTTAAYLSQVVPLVEAGKAVPLLTWGTLDSAGNLVRDPTFPDLPHLGEAYEMVYGKKPSGPAWNAWRAFHAAGFAAQKMLFLPAGTPADIITAYRDAAKAMVAEPGFPAAMSEALGDYPQAVGDDAVKLKEIATTVAPEDKQWVKDWLKNKHNATF